MGEHVVSRGNLLACVLVSCLPMVGVLGIAPVAVTGASAAQSASKPDKNARSYVLKNKRRVRGTKIHLPVGPSYVYYDYPYYHARGYYPTHIGGYIYYPYYYYTRSHDRHYRRPATLRSQRPPRK